jgi:hypothetical protein
LERDFFHESEVRGGLLGSLPVGLAFLWAVDTAEADTFSFAIVQHFEDVAVEDGEDWAGEVRCEYGLEGGNEEA